MSENPGRQGRELYEFGPFRVDPEKETLLRAGQFVSLTPKSFQILLVLIRNHREVVTKDDLMKTVWPDTFVEEANLSRNIFLLRRALGETAQEHRYIVTVPGRGYRLSERVSVIPEQELEVIAASHSTVQVEVTETKPWRWIIAGVAAVVSVGALCAGLAWFIPRRTAVLNAKDTVVLADFANSTGDPMFDETLRQGLAVQLQQSPFLSLISDQRIHHMLRLMERPADVRLTPAIARAICERTGSAAVLEGSVAALGSQYVLALEAKSCRTGDVLDREQVQTAKKEDVLVALTQIASQFRRRVGESLSTIQEHNTPLADATTPSLEALQAYSTGWKLHTSTGAPASLLFLKRAVEIDPDFALAHSTLGRVYSDLDESELAAQSTAKAWQLREHASDPEKFVIAANYQILAIGNLEQARQTCEAWANTYPREALPHTMLSGFPNKGPGRYEQAAAEARRAIELDPDFAMSYYNLTINNVYLDRLDEAENALHHAIGRGLQIDEVIMAEHDIAFLKEDQEGMTRAAARARQLSGGEAWIANKEAYAHAYSGHLQQARVLSRRAIEHATHEAQPQRAALWAAGESLREAFFGHGPQARKSAGAALQLSNAREVEFGAALALAMSGDTSRATAIADRIEKQFPSDSLARFSYLPVLRARLALNQGDPTKALVMMEAAIPYDLGASFGLFGGLYPAYLRGQAYLAAHQGPQAAIEFQKVLAHRGVVGSDPIGALAHLQMGRAMVLSGDRVKARTCYEDFLKLWASADPDIPILKQAQAEYSALK